MLDHELLGKGIVGHEAGHAQEVAPDPTQEIIRETRHQDPNHETDTKFTVYDTIKAFMELIFKLHFHYYSKYEILSMNECQYNVKTRLYQYYH